MKIGETSNIHGHEHWRPIDGQPGYSISSWGRVKSFKRLNAGKILPHRAHPNGYRQITLKQQGKRKDFYVHRLVAFAFLDEPPPPTYNFYKKKYIPCVVNHKDGDKTHNNVGNLEWVTASEDKIHACRVLGVLRGGTPHENRRNS